jgi:hypothetical protein
LPCTEAEEDSRRHDRSQLIHTQLGIELIDAALKRNISGAFTFDSNFPNTSEGKTRKDNHERKYPLGYVSWENALS